MFNGLLKTQYFLILFFCGLIFLAGKSLLWAQTDTTPLITPKPTNSSISIYSPTPTATFSYEEAKKKLELERLELENEKLKFEMEKLKALATKTTTEDKKDDKKEMVLYQQKCSEKAESLAKDNKDKANLLILDFVNGEAWSKGVRYHLYDIYSMAEDQKIEFKKYLDKRDMTGDDRNRYVIRNVSLLRYNQRSRGILTLKAPVKDEDYRVLSVDGVTFDSAIGDVRSAHQNIYFNYEGEGHRDKLKLLKYKFSQDFFTFSDKLEYGFDKDGKLLEIRFGVLDEN